MLTHLEADGADVGATTPVNVTVGTITGSLGVYGANGATSSFVDNSATDSGNSYRAEDGGLVELAPTPAASSTLEYDGAGTIALEHPGASNAVALDDVSPGDVLELPGTGVSAVSFGTTSFVVTTSGADGGTFDFTNVSYGCSVNGYTASVDASTGLEAITFTGPDRFVDMTPATSGPNSGFYLWSNAANWTNDVVPMDGESVSVTATAESVDGLPALSLNTLTLLSTYVSNKGTTEGSTVYVTSGDLSVATVAASLGVVAAYGEVAGITTPVTVTIGTITGDGTYDAVGPTARLVDNSAIDSVEGFGNNFLAEDGGFVELAPTPAATTTLQYLGDGGTIALEHPSASDAVALVALTSGDVLELPGSGISAVVIGTSSLDVTTTGPDGGSFDFTNLEDCSASGYEASFDSSTGLEAITFSGPNTFEQNEAATSGPLSGAYLWSNAANWTNRVVPVDGDSVAIINPGSNDDLPALSLNTLRLAIGGNDFVFGAVVVVTAGDLSIGTASGGNDSELLADGLAAGTTTPVNVTVDTLTGSDGIYAAIGATSSLVDNSATDSGNGYAAEDGGLVELAPTPAASSSLEYYGAGTIALENPGASNAVALGGISPGDVLELPGSAVSAVTFGTDSLDITTTGPGGGSFDFTNVDYDSLVGGYTASVDSSTGLEAITFAACYCGGTRIFTEHGDASIERLKIGEWYWP